MKTISDYVQIIISFSGQSSFGVYLNIYERK